MNKSESDWWEIRPHLLRRLGIYDWSGARPLASKPRKFVRTEMVRQFAIGGLAALKARIAGLLLVLYFCFDLNRPVIGFGVAFLHIVTLWVLFRLLSKTLGLINQGKEFEREARLVALAMGVTAFLWFCFLWTLPHIAERTTAEFMIALIAIVALSLMVVTASLYPPALFAILFGACLSLVPKALLMVSVWGFGPLMAFLLLLGLLYRFAGVNHRQTRRVALLQLQQMNLSRRLAQANGELGIRVDQLRVQADVDSLTGLRNRGGVNRAVSKVYDNTNADKCYAVMLLDIDHFKEVNDRYGHAVGDAVLRRFGKVLREWEGQEADRICGRWGGEEFVAIAAIDEMQTGAQLADSLRQALSMQSGEGEWPAELKISVSIGCTKSNRHLNLYKEIGRADVALYQAKNAGRDCYRIAA